MQQVMETDRTIEARVPVHVPVAAVGPFGQLWEKIEHAPGASAAGRVLAAFASPRGFLPTLWLHAGNGGAPQRDSRESMPGRAPNPFAAPRGFLP